MATRERASRIFDLALVRLHGAGYLRKWLILGAVIGVVAGLASVAFVHAIRLSAWFFLHVLGGYTPPGAAGEGGAAEMGFTRPWAIPLVIGLGGLVSGWIVWRFAPEAEGHGTDAAIEAVHRNPRGVRARASIVKIVASAITIGSGGSAGREGPTAHASAGFASLLARRLDLAPGDARIAVTAGIGAGIGAIFRAPLGGAVLGAEILYRDDLEAEAIFPTSIAAITGFSIFAAFEGFSPIFGYLEPGHFDRLSQLPAYAVIGLAAGLVGVLYAKVFYGAVRRFEHIQIPSWIKPAIGGVLVGVIGLLVPAAIGTGYGWLQRAMTEDGLRSMALWAVVAIPFVKIITTSLSIGSGGSGGIFGPGMVIGGFTGAAIWLAAAGLPGIPTSPAPFVIVGMTACFGSVAHAPLAMILMVAEMTGTLELVLPAMIAIGVASLVAGDRSIYAHQLRDRSDSPGHRLRATMPLLAAVNVKAAMGDAGVVVPRDAPREEVTGLLEATGAREAIVVDARGVYEGTIAVDRLTVGDGSTIRGLADPSAPALPEEATLEDAVEALASSGAPSVTVLDAARRPIGVVTAGRVMHGYRLALRTNLDQLGGAPPGTRLIEVTVPAGSPIRDEKVGAAPFPPGTVAVAIRRGASLVLPGPEDTIQAGDRLELLVPGERADDVRVAIFGTATQEPPSGPSGPEA